jgi:hypothetical protein
MLGGRNAFTVLLRFGIRRGRSPLLAGVVLALCLGGIAPAMEVVAPPDLSDVGASDAAVKVTRKEGAALPATAIDVAAVRKTIEAKQQCDGDERRRLLIFLLMNSARPVRPFAFPAGR